MRATISTAESPTRPFPPREPTRSDLRIATRPRPASLAIVDQNTIVTLLIVAGIVIALFLWINKGRNVSVDVSKKGGKLSASEPDRPADVDVKKAHAGKTLNVTGESGDRVKVEDAKSGDDMNIGKSPPPKT